MLETKAFHGGMPAVQSRTSGRRCPDDRSQVTSLWDLEEEIVNSLTHGVGLVLSIVGAVGLVVLASTRGSIWHLIGALVFGISLILVYLASTLYHASQRPRVKRIMRLFDCAAIYLFIAGTYTPFTLVSLHGPWGWALFGMIWSVALLGIVFMVVAEHRHDHFSLGVYLAMGWVALIAVKPIVTAVPPGGLLLLVGGGLAYTAGTIFYARDTSVRYFHAVWHLFVMLGSLLHFCAIYYYVLPVAA